MTNFRGNYAVQVMTLSSSYHLHLTSLALKQIAISLGDRGGMLRAKLAMFNRFKSFSLQGICLFKAIVRKGRDKFYNSCKKNDVTNME